MDNHIKYFVAVCASATGVVPRNIVTLPLVQHCYSYGFCPPSSPKCLDGPCLIDFADVGEPPPDLFHNLSSSVLLTVFEKNTTVFALLGSGHLVVYYDCFYEQYADICFSYGF